MRNRTVPLALLSLSLIAAPARAQDPESAEQLAAGDRVTTIELDRDPIEILIGDTITVTGRLVDASGARVEGARWGVQSSPGIFDVDAIKDSIPETYLLWGQGVGSTVLRMFVRTTAESGDGTWTLIDSVMVEVSEHPVARVAIGEARYRPYAGTTVSLEAEALTASGRKHSTAVVRWRSETPGIATVTESGVVRLLRPGNAVLVAAAGDITRRHEIEVMENPVRQIDVTPGIVTTRTGDVVRLNVRVLDGRGRAVEGVALSYAVNPLDSAGAEIYDDGAFVAENPGDYEVLVSAGAQVGRAVVSARPRNEVKRWPVRLVGRGPRADIATSDLWVFSGRDGRDYAYTGTMPQGGGERMYVWDVTEPGNPVLTDSVSIDARRVNDVKVNGDATWAITTGENSSNRRNGVYVLDISDPAHPDIIAHMVEGVMDDGEPWVMTGGIHNVWINGNVVYAINDGTLAMDIIDMSDPANPRYHGAWELRPGDTNKYLHDVWSDGRYAYLSYWNDGVVILDVGAGTHGGTPLDPVFVSSFKYPAGNTHAAYREGDYLFLGDEIFGCDDCINGPRGYIHVVDVSDIERPVEVARYEVPEAGSHNIWVENGILYVAYYQGGLRIVDVSGELRGDLYRQGREIGWYHTAAGSDALVPNAANAWGPQPFKGLVYVSDMNSGLWVLEHERPEQLSQ